MTLLKKNITLYFFFCYFFLFLFFLTVTVFINIKDFSDNITSNSFTYLLSLSFKDIYKISDFLILLSCLSLFTILKNRFHFIIFLTNGINFFKIFNPTFYFCGIIYFFNLLMNDISSNTIAKYRNNEGLNSYKLISIKENEDIALFYYQINKLNLNIKNFTYISKENNLYFKDKILISNFKKIKSQSIYNKIKVEKILDIIKISNSDIRNLSIIEKIKIAFLRGNNIDIEALTLIHEEIIYNLFLFFAYFLSLFLALKQNQHYDRFKKEKNIYTICFLILTLSRNLIFITIGRFYKLEILEKIIILISCYLIQYYLILFKK